MNKDFLSQWISVIKKQLKSFDLTDIKAWEKDDVKKSMNEGLKFLKHVQALSKTDDFLKSQK